MWSAPSTWAGALVSAEQLKDMQQIVPYVYPSRRNWGFVLLLNYCLSYQDFVSFTAFVSFCLTSLISNCFNLLLGTLGRPRREGRLQSAAGFHFPFSVILLNPEGIRKGQESE